MKLNDTRKEQGVEVANREYAKGARGWPTGGAGLSLWPPSVTLFAQV